MSHNKLNLQYLCGLNYNTFVTTIPLLVGSSTITLPQYLCGLNYNTFVTTIPLLVGSSIISLSIHNNFATIILGVLQR